MTSDRFEFSALEIAELLSELDGRLRARQISASIFVVGGAAIAATAQADSIRRTEDIDAITNVAAVMEEAALMAVERGLPLNWLNGSARMWMPPLPESALQGTDRPGLFVTYASDEFLFANKLIAQLILDGNDLDREISLLARRAARMLAMD